MSHEAGSADESSRSDGERPPPTRDEGTGRPGVRSVLRTSLAVVAAVLVTVLVLSNSESVEVSFLGWTANLPLFLVILLSVLLGAAIVLSVLGGRRAARAVKRRGS